MATEEQATATLNRLAEELRRRWTDIDRRLDYYAGNHKLCYASEEFRDYFASRFRGFSDNWTVPVIQSPAERMNVLGVRVEGDGDRPRDVNRELARVWRANEAERESSEAFVLALSASRAFALVWGNPEDESTPYITFERPDQAVVSYDPDTRRRRAALKLWADDDLEFATLYLPDEVWKFQRPRMSHLDKPESSRVQAATAPGGWEPRQADSDNTWPIANPMGVVPMVELRNQTLLDNDPVSDIDGVIEMQDTINLVWAYLLNALDYASLPQRIVTGAEVPKLPILDDQGNKVGERPVELETLIRERILWIPGDDAKTSEWSAAALDVYSNVIERAVEHIAAQTRTPPHYLIGRVANLSAEALTAAETGLVSKTSERVTYFTPPLRELFRLVALAQGNDGLARAVQAGDVVWADVQFRSLAQRVDAIQKLYAVGFPFEWLAEQYGLEPDEVQRVLEMRERESQQRLDDALASALSIPERARRSEQNGQPEPEPQAS